MFGVGKKSSRACSCRMCVGEIISHGHRGKEAPQEDLSLAETHTDSRGPL